jgi:tetratricopeptide (TPR) repeat protein
LPRVWNIPYARNPGFTGREKILKDIQVQLEAGQAAAHTPPQAISGLGGIGKTQIAVEYAYQHARDYEAVLWVLADSRESLVSGYMTIAELLNLPHQGEQDQSVIIQAVKTWLQTHGSWLLILDNADDLAQVSEFVPSIFEGHVLLTTRAQSMGRLAKRIEVETMSQDVGALFLLRRVGLIGERATLDEASSADTALAHEICQELGGLPLALDQAGAYIEEVQCSLCQYLERYRSEQAVLLKHRGGVVSDHPEGVWTTWSLNFQKVEEQSLAAANVLHLCAFLHPDAIPEEMITENAMSWLQERQKANEGWFSAFTAFLLKREHRTGRVQNRFVLDECIRILSAYSLIRRNSSEKMLSLHRLVQAVLKDAMNKGIYALWAERAVRAVAEALPPVDIELRPQWERFLPHALICAKLIEQQKMSFPEASELLQLAGSFLGQLARYAEAESLLLRALAISEQQLGPEDPGTATSLNLLALLYVKYGKYAEAEPLLQRALAISEQQFGSEDLSTAVFLNNLAWLYERQRRYAEAELLLQRALAIYEQQLEPEHLHIAHSLSILAWVYETQGKNTEVEPLHLRALAIRERQLGAEHPDTAGCLNNLADFYSRQGKHAEAESLYQRVLAIREQKLGPEHPDTATSLTHLAFLYMKQGKYGEAESLYHRALRIREQQFGPEHFEVAVSLNYLAWLYRQQGKYAEAEPLLQRALHIREKALEPQHPETAESIHNLASLREEQGNSEEARALYARALTMREQALGAHHPKTTETRTHLIVLLHTLGQHEEAAKLETHSG